MYGGGLLGKVGQIGSTPWGGVDGTECNGCGMGWIGLVVAAVSAVLFCSHLHVVFGSWIVRTLDYIGL